MADEIAEVVKVELEGIEMVVKGSVAAVTGLLKGITAIYRFEKESKDKKDEKKLNEAGEKSMAEIMKISKDGPAQVIMVSEKNYQDIMEDAEKKGFRICRLIDFDSTDGKIPIAVPYQDAAMFSVFSNSFLEKEIRETEETINNYDKSIAKQYEKVNQASPEEKDAEEAKLKDLQQAREEAKQHLEKSQEFHDNPAMSFQDYLMTGKGTEFEKDPDKAVTEYEQGVEIGREFSIKECLQPVRDPSQAPDSMMRFYLPESGTVVRRSFQTDQDTGLLYSTYSLKTDQGEMFEFSDRGVAKADWDEKVLPEILDKAEVIESTKCRIFNSEEAMETYISKHNQIQPLSEKNVEEKLKDGQEVFHQADAGREIEAAVIENRKKLASADKNQNSVILQFPADRIMQKDGKLQVQISDSEMLQIPGIDSAKMKDGRLSLVLPKEEIITHLTVDPESGTRTSREITAEKGKELLVGKQNGIKPESHKLQNGRK